MYGAKKSNKAMQEDVYFDDGELVIMAATAASKWADWQVIHTEKGPFGNEMLGDVARWKDTGILSILVQGAPSQPHEPTPLRVLDFRLECQ